MEVLTVQQALLERKSELKIAALSGAIFIYPTNTIYGIGGDATSEKIASSIRKAKGRGGSPFSIIPPSLAWVHEVCNITEAYSHIPDDKQAYTIILPIINPKMVAPSVLCGSKTLGIRIIPHLFMSFIIDCDLPFITTSVNRSGEQPATDLRFVPSELGELARYGIDDGIHDGLPSILLDCTGKKPREIPRS